MKMIPFYILLYLLLLGISCSSVNNNESPKDTLSVLIEVISEDQNNYVLSWKDTVGNKEKYGLHHRPIELWCNILNSKNEIIGDYKSPSFPRDYTFFSTDESSVKIEFSKDINFFSNLFSDKKLLESYMNNENNFTEFSPITIDLEQQLKTEIIFELEAK